jgi:sodium-dependent dicarboxylate transporter 2/3/5
MLACYLLSMWISNSATAACMVPIASTLLETICSAGGAEGADRRFGKGLMLGVAWGCSIGGMATLTGTGTNVAFNGFWAQAYPATRGITFISWLAFGLPLSAVVLLLAWLVLCAAFVRTGPGAAGTVPQSALAAERARLGPMSTHEKVVLGQYPIVTPASRELKTNRTY